jgi:hypothetical protein
MSAKARIRTKLPEFPSRDAWSAAWQKHWSKVGLPGYELPVGGRIKQGVFAKDEIGFGYVTDSPREAVDLILRSLPCAVGRTLRPLKAS